MSKVNRAPLLHYRFYLVSDARYWCRISLCPSVCPSVRRHTTAWSAVLDCHSVGQCSKFATL